MPRPEDVMQTKFPVSTVIYDGEDFAIAWGTWNKERLCLGMRWNTTNDAGTGVGYPNLFGNPCWFVLPDRLTLPILTAISDSKFVSKEAIRKVLLDMIGGAE